MAGQGNVGWQGTRALCLCSEGGSRATDVLAVGMCVDEVGLGWMGVGLGLDWGWIGCIGGGMSALYLCSEGGSRATDGATAEPFQEGWILGLWRRRKV